MKSYKDKTGVTLVEMLIVVAIIALLASMVIGIAARIDNQGKEQLAKGTIAILTNALEQFRDYGYRYPGPDYADFVFPLDCNGLDVVAALPILSLQKTLCNALGATDVSIMPLDVLHKPEYSGSEVLYFFLSKVPESRKTLDKIDSSLITNLSFDKLPMEIHIAFLGGTKVYPLHRIIDPWGTTLHYDYYNELILDPKSKRTFPVITSAGPDRIFGTADDITSR